jgi:hypothetical protein
LVSLTIRLHSKQPVPERHVAFLSDRSPGNPCPVQIIRASTPTPKAARKRKRRFFSNRRRNRPLSHHALQGKNLADISGPTRHWCSGQTINDALHVCVESKMRFLIDNHNPKNQQKITLTLHRLMYQKIHYVWKYAHLVSTMEQVLIQIVTQ